MVHDFRKQKTPPVTAKAPVKPPKPTPTKAPAPVEQPEHVTHQWPTVSGKPGTLVKFNGEVVGKVDEETGLVVIPSSGGIVSTEADKARHLIQQGLLTKLGKGGELQ